MPRKLPIPAMPTPTDLFERSSSGGQKRNHLIQVLFSRKLDRYDQPKIGMLEWGRKKGGLGYLSKLYPTIRPRNPQPQTLYFQQPQSQNTRRPFFRPMATFFHTTLFHLSLFHYDFLHLALFYCLYSNWHYSICPNTIWLNSFEKMHWHSKFFLTNILLFQKSQSVGGFSISKIGKKSTPQNNTLQVSKADCSAHLNFLRWVLK